MPLETVEQRKQRAEIRKVIADASIPITSRVEQAEVYALDTGDWEPHSQAAGAQLDELGRDVSNVVPASAVQKLSADLAVKDKQIEELKEVLARAREAKQEPDLVRDITKIFEQNE